MIKFPSPKFILPFSQSLSFSHSPFLIHLRKMRSTFAFVLYKMYQKSSIRLFSFSFSLLRLSWLFCIVGILIELSRYERYLAIILRPEMPWDIAETTFDFNRGAGLVFATRDISLVRVTRRIKQKKPTPSRRTYVHNSQRFESTLD